MGWGQIIGGGTDGLYTLALDYGVATRDGWIAAIDGWIDRMNVEIAKAEGALLTAEGRAATAEAELQGLITTLAGAGGTGSSEAPELMAKIDIATARYAQAAAARDAVRIPRDMRIAERKELVRKKNDLQSTVLQETKQAWCADFTEDATGYVATIEIPGENQAVLIAPGGREPGPGDGRLVARELMSPWQVFWNAAVLPGWQKWKPTYRKATITWLNSDANLANVTLDPATSSAAHLPINQTPQLNGVPIRYMDCDALAFAVGNRVVVEFEGQSWTSPRIIGFVESPKPCRWVMTPNADNGATPIIVCNDPGLIDEMLAEGEFTAWMNGAGPYSLQMIYTDFEEAGWPGGAPPPRHEFTTARGIFFHRNSKTGDGGSVYQNYNTLSNYIALPAEEGGYEADFVESEIVIDFVTPAMVAGNSEAWNSSGYPGGYSALQHGFAYLVGWSSATVEEIVEIVCRVGERKVLHLAFANPGFGLITKYKGVPARTLPGFSKIFEPLTEYTFIGS